MSDIQRNKFDLKQSGFVQGMLDASINGVIMLEPVYEDSNNIIDFIVRAANHATIQHIGIAPNDAIDKPMSSLVPGYKAAGFFDVYITALRTKQIQREELQYEDERTEGWYEIGVAPIDNLIVVTFANITKYKRYQQELETAASRLDAIINTSQSGIFLFKPVFNTNGQVVDFTFTIANPALAGYVGQKQETVVGGLGSKWFPAYKTNGLFARYSETYITGKVNRFDFHYNADNIDVWLDILATKLGDEVLVTFTDYTPVKKLQLELEKSVEELKRSNANLEEFAYVASHDLQEPLRKIQYFAERLKSIAADNNDSHPFLDRMDAAIIRMRTLIEDLLAYSKSTTKVTEFVTINLNDLVHEVLTDLEAVISEKAAVVTVKKLPAIKGDALQLRQLFQNIIGNALKYNRADVRLEISIDGRIADPNEIEALSVLETDRKFNLIQVTDNGVGFEQTHAKQIFKIFQRLHGRSEYPGTGVGLAIVQKVVENHNGYVFAEGIPCNGATFKVLFPVA